MGGAAHVVADAADCGHGGIAELVNRRIGRHAGQDGDVVVVDSVRALALGRQVGEPISGLRWVAVAAVAVAVGLEALVVLMAGGAVLIVVVVGGDRHVVGVLFDALGLSGVVAVADLADLGRAGVGGAVVAEI